VLTFFIAGFLYLLRFEGVDNLGAYRIPSETGLLIPSDFASYSRLQLYLPENLVRRASTSRQNPRNKRTMRIAKHANASFANSSGLRRFATNVTTRMSGIAVAMAMRLLDFGNWPQYESVLFRTKIRASPPSEPTTKQRTRKPPPAIRSMCMLRAARNTTASVATSSQAWFRRGFTRPFYASAHEHSKM
jgi:hypothetical protein